MFRKITSLAEAQGDEGVIQAVADDYEQALIHDSDFAWVCSTPLVQAITVRMKAHLDLPRVSPPVRR